MPRFKIGEPAQAAPTWQNTLVDRIRQGNLVPIISGSLCNDLVLGNHADLVKAYAQHSLYPVPSDELSRITQYRSITADEVDVLAIKDDYITFAKSWLFELAQRGGIAKDLLDEVDAQFDTLQFAALARQLGYPRFADGQNDALLLLASFPISVYVTTSFHTFLEAALEKAGKAPRSELCRWHSGLKDIPNVLERGYQPSPAEPLVYHLHGSDTHPDSLVLTEDDHLRFLVATAQDVGPGKDPVHNLVRGRVSDSSLLLLGYSLASWEFRSLFWGLVEQRTRHLTGAVAIQLADDAVEQTYVQRYLDRFEFKVFLGPTLTLLQTLYHGYDR